MNILKQSSLKEKQKKKKLHYEKSFLLRYDLESFILCINGMEMEGNTTKYSIPGKMLSFTGLSDASEFAKHFFTPDLYGQQVKILALTTKGNSLLIQDIGYVQQLINYFVEKFERSHEKIAKGLPLKAAKKIMGLQNELLVLCDNPFNASLGFCKKYYETKNKKCFLAESCGYECECVEKFFAVATQERVLQCIKEGKNTDVEIHPYLLEQFCQEGAGLNFTYEKEQNTPFFVLCSTSAHRHNRVLQLGYTYHVEDRVLKQLMRFFIEQSKKGTINLGAVDKNGRNAFMVSLLKSADWVAGYFLELNQAEKDIIKLKDILNHQDNEGNTALLLCLLDRGRGITQRLMMAYIAAGADPEIANNAGLTPLAQLKIGCEGPYNCFPFFENAYKYIEQVIAARKAEREKASIVG